MTCGWVPTVLQHFASWTVRILDCFAAMMLYDPIWYDFGLFYVIYSAAARCTQNVQRHLVNHMIKSGSSGRQTTPIIFKMWTCSRQFMFYSRKILIAISCRWPLLMYLFQHQRRLACASSVKQRHCCFRLSLAEEASQSFLCDAWPQDNKQSICDNPTVSRTYQVKNLMSHWFVTFDHAIRLCILWCGDAKKHQVHATTCSTVRVAFLCQAIGIEVRSPVALALVWWSAAVYMGSERSSVLTSGSCSLECRKR